MWHTVEQLGPKQALLPSGALLCRDVTIARSGVQTYHPSEIGLDGDSMVRVQRDAEQVFDAKSMASFEAAPITMLHPFADIRPSNWRLHAVGHVHNVRRVGDRLVADLLIHDQQAIDAIRNRGWRGVSCGYDARYEGLGPGRARQVNIVGNHLALLPPEQPPRCGVECMIGDSQWGERDMRTYDASAPPMGNPRMNSQGLIVEQTPSLATTTTALAGGRNPGDQGPRLAGNISEQPSGRQGAQVSVGEVGGELVMKLPGGISDYYISALEDGATGVGLYRFTLAEKTGTEGSDRRMARTGDAFAYARSPLRQARDAQQHATLRSIAEAQRTFWARPENQGHA